MYGNAIIKAASSVLRPNFLIWPPCILMVLLPDNDARAVPGHNFTIFRCITGAGKTGEGAFVKKADRWGRIYLQGGLGSIAHFYLKGPSQGHYRLWPVTGPE